MSDQSFIYNNIKRLPYDHRKAVVEQIFNICRNALTKTSTGGIEIDLIKLDPIAMQMVKKMIQTRRIHNQTF
jgi:hypothetical protein